MATRKKRAVFTAEPDQLEQIHAIVRAGEYRSASQFLREAIQEKLEKLRQERLKLQVEQYCNEGAAREDRELANIQAFEVED